MDDDTTAAEAAAYEAIDTPIVQFCMGLKVFGLALLNMFKAGEVRSAYSRGLPEHETLVGPDP